MNGTEQNPPIERVIKLGCVPRLVSFLPQAGNPKLQFEAAWALTNIASGNSDQTMVLLQFVRPIPYLLLISLSLSLYVSYKQFDVGSGTRICEAHVIDGFTNP
mgnify:CR=1 FL=1